MVLESQQENLYFEPYGTVLSQLNPQSPVKVNSGCWIHEPPPIPLFSFLCFCLKKSFQALYCFTFIEVNATDRVLSSHIKQLMSSVSYFLWAPCFHIFILLLKSFHVFIIQ
jgi:hypothetical protein